MPTNLKSYGTYGSGASGRRQYLRHNPTDWKVRAMGGRKKVTIKNIVTTEDDVRSTAGKGVTGTQGGPAANSKSNVKPLNKKPKAIARPKPPTHINKIQQLRSKKYPFGDKKTTETRKLDKGNISTATNLLAVPATAGSLLLLDKKTGGRLTGPSKAKVGRPKAGMLKKVKKKVSNVKSVINKKASKLKKKVTSTKTYQKIEEKKRKFKKTKVGKKITKAAKVTKKYAKRTPKWTLPSLLGSAALGGAAGWFLKD